jgi:alpha-tubulin suppressor-like RCC1 family protein
MRRKPTAHRVFLAALASLAGCSEATRPPEAPGMDAPATTLAVLSCEASVTARTLRCAPSSPVSTGARANLIFGGQNSYVRLASGEVNYNSFSEIFNATVSVTNLMGQPIGTVDGVTPDADGVRVFFHSGPTATSGSGTVTVANADGMGDFTGTNQPYHSYAGILTTDQTSNSLNWQFGVPVGVNTFSFVVYVVAAVPHEQALQKIDFDPRTLSTGGGQSCALTTAGAAWCWGEKEGAPSDSIPVLVGGGHVFRSISAGRFHVCAVTTGNQAFCWGDNQTGQLGDGGVADTLLPVPVAGGHSFKQVDAGAGHSCGVTTTLEAYCWGDNAAGQLGTGDSVSTNTPVLVSGNRRWASVDAGTDHSCGVSRGGAGYCWGDNSNGELGINPADPATVAPRLVAGNHSWASISAGESFSCGVSSLNVGYCWGLDGSGQIGNGPAAAPNTPDVVNGGYSWRVISAGRETSCGVTTTGVGYCWGFNNTGEIGDGTTTYSDAPVPVTPGNTWRWIDGGDYHTCGITTSGGALCWGYNFSGQLGDNTKINHPGPAPVFGAHTWAQ